MGGEARPGGRGLLHLWDLRRGRDLGLRGALLGRAETKGTLLDHAVVLAQARAEPRRADARVPGDVLPGPVGIVPRRRDPHGVPGAAVQDSDACGRAADDGTLDELRDEHGSLEQAAAGLLDSRWRRHVPGFEIVIAALRPLCALPRIMRGVDYMHF